MKSNTKEKNNNPKKNAGFYIALALCITAIGGAAWTTYSSVLDYQTPKEESSAQSEGSKPKDKPTDKTVSGLEYSKPESKTESSEKTANTILESRSESSEESSELSIEESSSESSEISQENENKFIKPIDGKIIKGYSPENPVYSKTMGDWRVHEGIDITADDGEKVRAYSGGIVKKVYNDDLLGYSIEIEHNNGITMIYSGLSPTILVKEGESVSCGDYIGAVFTIPSEIMDEVHLQQKKKKDGKLIDAQAVLEKNA